MRIIQSTNGKLLIRTLNILDLLNNKNQNLQTQIKRSAGILLAVFLLAGSFFLPVKSSAARAEEKSYIVKLKTGSADKILEGVGRKIRPEFEFADNERFENIYLMNSFLSAEEIKSKLGEQAEYVEVDRELQVFAEIESIPRLEPAVLNDPGFTSNELNIDKQWGLAKVGYNFAWSRSIGSASNVVAVVDTGIDFTHEDLQSIRVVSGYNFITGQKLEGNINSDDNGHGTLVAGILGATANNGMGVAGTNWSISIMPIKALDETGKGTSSAVAKSIVWAADHGANIINLSLGGIGFGHDQTLANSIEYAFEKGLVIVAAAGNDVVVTGGDLDKNPVYPICADNDSNMIIGVTATDHNDLKPPFANFGKNCIDVSAPGKRILSTINYDPITRAHSPNSYAYASGSSLAVPYVAGQAALLMALNPEATNSQIRDHILATTDSIDNLNLSQCNGGSCRGLLGAGRINVKKSIQSKIAVTAIAEGDLISLGNGSSVYQIIGGQRRLVSQFVMNQRLTLQPVKVVTSVQLANFSDGAYAAPADGTLIKTADSPTVYMVVRGQKFPVTKEVFNQRRLNFSQVATLSSEEVNSWLTSNLLVPEEGTLVKSKRNPTVYWVVGQVLHPVNSAFYVDRGLKVLPLFIANDRDLAAFPKGEAFVR